MRKSPSLVLALLLTGIGGMRANPGHETTVAELNAQIANTPEIAELYFQRAWNYREMQLLPEARADWEKTLQLNPGFLPASRELARADASEGKAEAGIARLRQAMAKAPADQAFHLPGCFSVLAELLLKEGKNEEALAEARAGLAASPDFLMDLCLLRSEAQRRLGRFDERVQDLAAAMTKLRSFVVKLKWYDAMIDAGRGREVLPEIEEEVSNTRFQAGWLIRRARIRQQSGETTLAGKDLATALEEVESRLRPENPDLSLVCDRGVIYALQGKTSAARLELASARQQGADFWLMLPLEATLEKLPQEASVEPKKPGAEPFSDGNKAR